jgi:hypothetical protein
VSARRIEDRESTAAAEAEAFRDGGATEARRIARKLIGEDIQFDRAPRSGTDVTRGFAALEELRAMRHGWSSENPPRLERLARVVTV